MKSVNITELEKKTLRQALGYGFAFDLQDDDDYIFICWGVDGKQERGALTSLNKKGVLKVYHDHGETSVYCGNGYTVDDLIEISGFKKSW